MHTATKHEQLIRDYESVARLIELHNESAPETRNLDALARHIGMTESSVQRLFSRWAGISPKRFAQYLNAREIRALMQNQGSLLDLSLDAGLSSTSLVHDHFVRFYAMTPGQARKLGSGLLIRHGFYPSPFGDCHIATTDKGICWLAFSQPVSREESLQQLMQEWPNAQLQRDDSAHKELVASLFTAAHARQPLYLHIKGSNFQLRVWEALLKIPAGELASYQDIARLVDAPTAARAVGSAIGRNPVSWLIPCHRVIRASGVVGMYRWGRERKQSLLAWEQGVFNAG